MKKPSLLEKKAPPRNKSVSIKITDQAEAALAKLAEESGRTRSEIVWIIIDEWMRDKKLY